MKKLLIIIIVFNTIYLTHARSLNGYLLMDTTFEKQQIKFSKGVLLKLLSQDNKNNSFIYNYRGLNYVFPMSSIELTADTLFIAHRKIPAIDLETDKIVTLLKPGIFYQLLSRSSETTNITGVGRYYYYKIRVGNDFLKVFGAYSNLAYQPVDCQCVDYFKEVFRIQSPVGNAKDLEPVITGQKKVKIQNFDSFIRLKFRRIIPDSNYSNIDSGDVVVFRPPHKETHPIYGHVGFVIGFNKNKILVKGANQRSSYFTNGRCNNISTKWYYYDPVTTFIYKRKILNKFRV